MLHLSTMVSKTSYITKAAYFAAGLLALFASSTVLADTGVLTCKGPKNVSFFIQSVAGQGTAEATYRLVTKDTGVVLEANQVQCFYHGKQVVMKKMGAGYQLTVDDAVIGWTAVTFIE